MAKDIKPEYSKNRVNQAGKKVRDKIQTVEDIEAIENWRASHNHVLNTWQATLRKRTKDTDIMFAQRLKRRITIFDKLIREPTMALSNMHDIAGCRLIFRNINDLNSFRENLHNKNRFKHELYKKDEDPYNYIVNPRHTGYRGIHDVFIYKASHLGGQPWDGLKVEIQYRTIQQHAWATAVEVAGSLTGNQSKFGRGSDNQKEFFKLSSEIIARAHEHMNSCYASLSNQELVSKFEKLEKRIHLMRNLANVSVVSSYLDDTRGKHVILESKGGGTFIHTFSSRTKATDRYFQMEKEAGEDHDIVLVRAESIDSVRKVYQNYFSDADDFVRLITTGIGMLKSGI